MDQIEFTTLMEWFHSTNVIFFLMEQADQPLNSQKWLKYNFSLQYPYTIQLVE